MKNQTASNIERAFLALALIATLLCAGCNIVAPIAYAIEGPPKKDAVASLEKGRTTVIFIDDRDSRLPKRSLRNNIAAAAEQNLLDKGIIAPGKMVAAVDALRASAGESGGAPMSIVDIGRAVGAEVIVYAKVGAFTLSRDTVSISPAAALEIKIFDTLENERIWPEGDNGYPLVIRLPTSQGQLFAMSLTQRSAAERELANTVGIRIAQMFYRTERTSGLGT